MTVKLKKSQLEERLHEFCERAQGRKPPYSTLYLAEYRYLSSCKKIRSQHISLKSPEIVNAERIYGEALLLESEGGSIKSVALKIMSAHKQLLNVLIENYKARSLVIAYGVPNCV